jgi:hypothetical protein
MSTGDESDKSHREIVRQYTNLTTAGDRRAIPTSLGNSMRHEINAMELDLRQRVRPVNTLCEPFLNALAGT